MVDRDGLENRFPLNSGTWGSNPTLSASWKNVIRKNKTMGKIREKNPKDIYYPYPKAIEAIGLRVIQLGKS